MTLRVSPNGPNNGSNEDGERESDVEETISKDECPPDERKTTVLETHGYKLGKTIGTGSYATVKVILPFT